MPRSDPSLVSGAYSTTGAPRRRPDTAAPDVYPQRRSADRGGMRTEKPASLAPAEPGVPSDRASALRLLLPGSRAGETLAERRHVVARLERALRCERRLGRAGHWAYDLSRHVALTQWLRHEREALRQTSNETGRPEGRPVEPEQPG